MPIAPHSRSDLDLSKVDWSQADATSEADITRQAAEDGIPYEAEQDLLQARQLAGSFGQDTQPVEAKLRWLSQLASGGRQPPVAATGRRMDRTGGLRPPLADLLLHQCAWSVTILR